MPFTMSPAQGIGPLALRGYASATPTTAVTGVGMSVVPQPSLGVMRVTAWWPSATQLRLVRISADGTRTPVRGGYSYTVVGTTRRNQATNPSIEVSTAGYTAGTGSPTLTRIARGDDPGGAWSLNAVNASAGSSAVNVPHALTVGQVTVGLDLRLSAAPSGVTVTLGWLNSTGGALTATTVALTSGQYTASVGSFARQVVDLLPPAGAAQAGTLTITATGMPAAGQMGIDRVTAETAATDGSYFDGASTGGSWSGTTHLSSSVLAPVQTIDDGEAPLDVPVSYELTNPLAQGVQLVAPAETLSSENRVWLTHPGDPGEPVEVFNTATPELEHVIDQGVFPILDSKYPVAVSVALRRAPTGSLELVADTFAARDALLTMFADGTPVLLRTPSTFGYGEGMWIVLGNLRENPLGQKGSRQLRTLSAPFQVVAAPADFLGS